MLYENFIYQYKLQMVYLRNFVEGVLCIQAVMASCPHIRVRSILLTIFSLNYHQQDLFEEVMSVYVPDLTYGRSHKN
jgi:hypothetical protein